MGFIKACLLSGFLASSTVATSITQPLSIQNALWVGHDDPSVAKRLDDIIADSPLLSLHRSLSEIESISNHEQNVGEFIVSYLQARNFTVEKQIVPLGDATNASQQGQNPRFNVYAYPSWSSRPEIIVTSHIDTVPPFIPYSLSLPSDASMFRREDILISGRGTVDAKASVASQIIATLSHIDKYPDTALALLFVVSEERGGDGMRHFSASSLNTSPPTFHTIIFGEPTELTLVSGHKGSLHFNISAKGVPAHSGYPWLGLSAISEILPALSKLDVLGDIPVSEGGLPSSEKYGRSTLNIGVMEGGLVGNVLPASASAAIMVRLASGTVEEAKSAICRAVHNSTRGNGNITVQFLTGAYKPVDLDTDVNGFNITTVNYGTDVPNWEIHDQDAPVKVKRYLYGPGSILVAHGENEGLTVGELEIAVEGYSRLIVAAVERGKQLRG